MSVPPRASSRIRLRTGSGHFGSCISHTPEAPHTTWCFRPAFARRLTCRRCVVLFRLWWTDIRRCAPPFARSRIVSSNGCMVTCPSVSRFTIGPASICRRSGKKSTKLRRLPFDLQNGPLMRVDLFTRAADDQILLFTVHHIAADGWSLFLLLDDLRRIYPAERDGGAPPPPRPVHDILEHSRWQEAMLAGPEGQAHEAYWLSKLAGVLTPLSMPTDRPRPVSLSERGASLPIDLGGELSDAVRALAAREGTTPFVVLLTAYQVLLHRYTGQQEVIVGSPTYGRDRAEFADVVGYFINMIPLKAAFHDDPPFRELLARGRARRWSKAFSIRITRFRSWLKSYSPIGIFPVRLFSKRCSFSRSLNRLPD